MSSYLEWTEHFKRGLESPSPIRLLLPTSFETSEPKFDIVREHKKLPEYGALNPCCVQVNYIDIITPLIADWATSILSNLK